MLNKFVTLRESPIFVGYKSKTEGNINGERYNKRIGYMPIICRNGFLRDRKSIG